MPAAAGHPDPAEQRFERVLVEHASPHYKAAMASLKVGEKVQEALDHDLRIPK